jgi:hypothetical protein
LSKIVIGKYGTANASLDVDALLRTRMLVQANSGKGKSWLLRRIAEQLFGKVQVLIVDPEGEFATLREKFGYVLVGKGGETPADPRSAALVAHRLLELRASAVCDLYEVKPATRHDWVARFLDALIDAPKTLWHPCVVIVDEAHVYCPEKGAGESIASEAMIGLATRGRKRGFSCIFATQRLGKLRKDAAAELLNVFIGGTFIDIDRKRAADALGVYGKDQHKFFDDIKLLDRGSFYALGPAISQERILIKVDPVETTHPEAGSAKHAAEPPPAPDKIKAMLPKLADLPKSAEEKAKTEGELRAKVRDLERQIRSAPVQKVQPGAAKSVTDSRVVNQAVRALLSEQTAEARERARDIKNVLRDVQAARKLVEKIGQAMANSLLEIRMRLDSGLHGAPSLPEKVAGSIPAVRSKDSGGEIQERSLGDRHVTPGRVSHDAYEPRSNSLSEPRTARNGDSELTPYQRDILRGLAELDAIGRSEVPRGLAGAAAGKSHKSSTFERYVAQLRSQGLVEYRGTKLALTDTGREHAGAVDQSLSADDVQERLLKILTPYQREMVAALITAGGEAMSWDELGEKIRKSAASSTFERYMASLRSAEIVEYSGSKRVKAAAWLFLE